MRTDRDACFELLPRVSRTFALNIRILPGDLRPSVTVAYLLFRLVDTIEDTPGLVPPERSLLFGAVLDRLSGRRPLVFPGDPLRRVRANASTAERDLVDAGECVFRFFETLPATTRGIVAEHVTETTRGMDQIATRRTGDGLLRLQTWSDLDEYCYYVAGTIGVMLTRLFVRHSRHIDVPSAERLTEFAPRFGRGLQLTNILKGIGVDHGQGRVYLPIEALSRHGVQPERILDPSAREGVLAVVREVVPRAMEDLEDALGYTTSIPRRELRLRLFCVWPLFTALRTLGRIAHGQGVADAESQPKISRGELYGEMAMSALESLSDARLRQRFARFRRELFPDARGEAWVT